MEGTIAFIRPVVNPIFRCCIEHVIDALEAIARTVVGVGHIGLLNELFDIGCAWGQGCYVSKVLRIHHQNEIKRVQILFYQGARTLGFDGVAVPSHNFTRPWIGKASLMPARCASGINEEFQVLFFGVNAKQFFTNRRTADVAKAYDQDTLHSI